MIQSKIYLQISRNNVGALLSQAGGSSEVRGRRERTLVCESRDLLGYNRVLFHAGARSAHTFQRRLGDHLTNKCKGKTITRNFF